MTKLCNTCEYLRYCARSGIEDVRLRPIQKDTTTNEEWLRQASTEDVAKWLSKLSKLFHECGKRDVYPKTMYEEDWEWWLKEIHNDNA